MGLFPTLRAYSGPLLVNILFLGGLFASHSFDGFPLLNAAGGPIGVFTLIGYAGLGLLINGLGLIISSILGKYDWLKGFAVAGLLLLIACTAWILYVVTHHQGNWKVGVEGE